MRIDPNTPVIVGCGQTLHRGDGTEEAPEPVELIVDRILRASRHLGDPTRIRVNPDCGLRTRSWDVIWGKLTHLVEAAGRARKSSEGAAGAQPTGSASRPGLGAG